LDINEELMVETIEEIYEKYFSGVPVMEVLNICACLTFTAILNLPKNEREMYLCRTFDSSLAKLQNYNAI